MPSAAHIGLCHLLVNSIEAKQHGHIPVEQVANLRGDEVKGLQVVGETGGSKLVEALVQDIPENDVVEVPAKTVEEATGREQASEANAEAVKGEGTCRVGQCC